MANDNWASLKRSTLLGATLVMLWGCGPQVTLIVQQYPGPARERSNVAVLRIGSVEEAQLESIDGEALGVVKLADDTRLHIELLPGVHTLQIRHPGKAVDAVQSVRFQAEAGALYHARLEDRDWYQRPGTPPTPGAWTALVYEIDDVHGYELREVSLPRPKPADGVKPVQPPAP